jgi:hypothetical protein
VEMEFKFLEEFYFIVIKTALFLISAVIYLGSAVFEITISGSGSS